MASTTLSPDTIHWTPRAARLRNTRAVSLPYTTRDIAKLAETLASCRCAYLAPSAGVHVTLPDWKRAQAILASYMRQARKQWDREHPATS